MLGDRPADGSGQPGQQPPQKQPDPPPRLDPHEPRPDPPHQLVETTPPTIRVYAMARSHRATVLSPYNPRSSTVGCGTSRTATPPGHELRLEYQAEPHACHSATPPRKPKIVSCGNRLLLPPPVRASSTRSDVVVGTGAGIEVGLFQPLPDRLTRSNSCTSDRSTDRHPGTARRPVEVRRERTTRPPLALLATSLLATRAHLAGRSRGSAGHPSRWTTSTDRCAQRGAGGK